MPILSTPHGDKLNALLENEKLPESDRPNILEALTLYKEWLKKLKSVTGGLGFTITHTTWFS